MCYQPFTMIVFYSLVFSNVLLLMGAGCAAAAAIYWERFVYKPVMVNY